MPSDITEIDIEATSDYSVVSYISKIKFNGTKMSYNDGNVDYVVYSNGKWASTDAQSITTVAEHSVSSENEKEWWLENTDLIANDDGSLTPPPTLNDLTWAEISELSANGKAQKMFAIGDTKTIHIEGTVGTLEVNDDFDAVLIGIDHNEEIEGKGLTFQLFQKDGIRVALCDRKYDSPVSGDKYFNINHSSSWTNAGGWQGCDMRYDILGSVHAKGEQYANSTTATNPLDRTLMSALPQDLRAVMKPITKWSDNVGGGNDILENVTKTIDYMPLLAEYEIFGKCEKANSTEQKFQRHYDYYYDTAHNRLKKKQDLTPTVSGNGINWWTRTATANSPYNFCYVSTISNASAYTSTYSYGIAPIFKV